MLRSVSAPDLLLGACTLGAVVCALALAFVPPGSRAESALITAGGACTATAAFLAQRNKGAKSLPPEKE